MGDKNMPVEKLVRHGKPGKYDQASYGAQCKVIDNKGFDLYIQRSNKEDEPDWEYIGSFPHDADEHFIENLSRLRY